MSKGNTLSANEAAEILGVTPKTVYNMCRSGYLTRVGRLCQHIKFDTEEVYALRELREEGLPDNPTQLNAALVQTRARYRSLENRVESLERLAGVHSTHLSHDREDVLSLLWKVERALSEPPLDMDGVRYWVDVFLGLHEEFFDLVETYGEHPEPWKPFLALAQKVYKDCPTPSGPELHNIVLLQSELHIARKNLRHAAWAYVSNRRGLAMAAEEFPGDHPDPVTHLLRHHVLHA